MPIEQWKAFKSEHGKSYGDDEDAKRFVIFEENLVTVNAHNQKYERGEVGYSKGLNQFSDWIPFTWAEATVAAKPAAKPTPMQRSASSNNNGRMYEDAMNRRVHSSNGSLTTEMVEVFANSQFFNNDRKPQKVKRPAPQPETFSIGANNHNRK